MALSNSEYNSIMREYEERRYRARHELDERTREVYGRIPRIKDIQAEISTAAVENMKSRLRGVTDGDNCTRRQLHDRIEALMAEKAELMKQYGYDADYLKPEYVCADCNDTGYIGSEKCHCLKEKITEVLYSRSNLREILEKENFSTFNQALYSPDFVDKVTGDDALENIQRVLGVCREFTHGFGRDFQNLFIYGETGVGKTFLTNCMAKELMDSSYSVIYMSAIHMFDVLADSQFGRNADERGGDASELTDCDLLIIDDLGTELINSFTISALFNCLNERFLKRKPVIISTNLSIGEIRELYSERVFSRIASNYTMLKIFGKDLRIVTSLGLTNS